MATSSTYCTHRDLEDIFPNINDYDSKEAIYGWTSAGSLHAAQNTGLVSQLFRDGANLGDPELDIPNSTNEWQYVSAEDVLYFYHTSDPNDLLMEAGEDFATLITRVMGNASRYFDSRVDATLPRDQWKDKEGNYDYLIIRTVALISIVFLLKAHDPNSIMIKTFEEEYNFNLEVLNSGQARLSNQVSGDSSKGTVREVVSPQNTNPLHIVDTRGRYSGVYDLIKVVISTAGAIGTAKFDVFAGDNTGLKQNKTIDAQLITGDYQSIGGGLQIRFAGKNDSSSATVGGTPDEWEIEVWGEGEEIDNNPIRGIRTSRRRGRIATRWGRDFL